MNFYITWFLIGRTIFFAPVIRKSMIKYLDIFSPLAVSKKEMREWLTEKSREFCDHKIQKNIKTMNTWFIELHEVDRRKLIDELYILCTKKPAQKYDCDAGRGESEGDTDYSLMARNLLLFWSPWSKSPKLYWLILWNTSAVKTRHQRGFLIVERTTINNQVLFCVIQARMSTS